MTAGVGVALLGSALTACGPLVSVNGTGTESGNQSSAAPAFSPDGTKIASHSQASDLVPGDTDAAEDVFIRDLTTSTTTLITPADSGINGSRAPCSAPTARASSSSVMPT